MGLEKVEPTESKRDGPGKGDETTVFSHPAFGQITINRTSGQSRLYGSEFTHQYWITIRVYKSEWHRHLSNDWHHQRGCPAAEIHMTEAQWASFVSSVNQGSGVLCTLFSIGDQQIPQIAKMAKRRELFAGEAESSINEARLRLERVIATLEETNMPKGARAEVISQLEFAKRAVSGSLEFVADQFDEHMEEMEQVLKAEVNGYAQRVLESQAGRLRQIGKAKPSGLVLQDLRESTDGSD